jgi:hypothetical protein
MKKRSPRVMAAHTTPPIATPAICGFVRTGFAAAAAVAVDDVGVVAVGKPGGVVAELEVVDGRLDDGGKGKVGILGDHVVAELSFLVEVDSRVD